MKSYTPRADSLAERVCNYFSRLPDEELSTSDIAIKFDAQRHSVAAQLETAVTHGYLIREGMAFRAGPKLPPPGTPAAVGGSIFPATRNGHGGPRTPFECDWASIKVEKDVPLQPRGERHQKVFELFDKLEVNDSFVVPIAGKHTIASAMTAYRKKTNKTLKRRVIDGDQVRVWRTA